MKDSVGASYWKRVVFLLFMGWFSIWVYRTMLTPVFAQIQQTVGPQTDAALGLVSSCYFFGYVLMQIPGGVLMDRVGKKRVMIPGFLLFGLGILVVAGAENIVVLYAGSALAGAATGTYYSGAFSLSTQNVPPRHKFLANAVVNSGCAVGMMAGLIGSSFVTKRLGAPWQGAVYGAAVLAFLMAPVFAVALRGDRAQEAPPPQAAPPAGESGLRGLFTAGHLAAYFFYFCTCYGYYMIVTWLPSFLEQERGVAGAAVGFASSVVAAASIPGALFFGRMLDRFQHRKVWALTLLQLFSALMLVLAASLKSVGLLMLCLALYGVAGKQAADPLIVPHITGLNAGEKLSTGLGVFNTFGMSSSILAPSVTGLISDVAGTRAPGFFLGAGLLLLSAVIFYAVNRKK